MRRLATVVIVASLALSASGAGATTPGAFTFEPLAESALCSAGDPMSDVPLQLPEGIRREVLAEEVRGSDSPFPDQADMQTLNETGPHAGRYLYRTHEVAQAGSVSVTDLETRTTRLLHSEPHWERLDGIEWTQWGTLLVAEEVRVAQRRDPNAPSSVGGLVYEIDPLDPHNPIVRPAVGSRAHEGLAFDAPGNLYGIAEVRAVNGGGAIYQFEPDRYGDLSSGRLSVLKLDHPSVDKTGAATWVELDDTASAIDSEAAADAAGATVYFKPEDLEVNAETLYVAISDEHRVIAVDLRGSRHQTTVSDYVVAGVNAPSSAQPLVGSNSFAAPDNLAFDSHGHLFITEDPGGLAPAKTRGNDIWVASPPSPGEDMAATVVRFATLTDCNAEPSGVYFDRGSRTLYVHIMHRGGPLGLLDQSLAVTSE